MSLSFGALRLAAAQVASSMANPSSQAKRTRRSTLSASERRMSSGSSLVVRMIWRSKSAKPCAGSSTSPVARSAYMALTEKSRRHASSARRSPKTTSFGRCVPPSAYDSRRNVVCSTRTEPKCSSTVPISAAFSITRMPCFGIAKATCSGVRREQTSISDGGRPSSAFRTRPPTA